MPTPQPHYLKKAAALHRPRAVVPSGTFANGVDGSLPVKVTYDIAVMGGEETAYEFSESIAPAAFATKEGEGQVINALIMKYERGVFESKAWICAGKDCEKQATTFASYHMSALRSSPPGARTIAFPIHETGSECHKETEEIWAATQAQLAKQAGISTEEIDTDDLPVPEGSVAGTGAADAKFDGVD